MGLCLLLLHPHFPIRSFNFTAIPLNFIVDRYLEIIISLFQVNDGSMFVRIKRDKRIKQC